MRILTVLIFLLSGCAANPLIKAERPGAYPSQISKKEYAKTRHENIYVSRDTGFGKTPIPYKVIYDNTKFKADLAAKYETDDNFRLYVASFITHEGQVNCETKENNAKVTHFTETMTFLRSEYAKVYSEASDIICEINKF
jgi:hypothetical protein